MAVPKQRTSKAKKCSRKSNWKKQASIKANKAFSLAKSVINNKSKSFVYIGESNKGTQ
nr:ribosomal protein L32 [Cavernulicola chilensis]